MKIKPLKRAPVILAAVVLALVCGLRWLNPDFLEQVECKTYDLRARAALRFPARTATNFASVAIDDNSLKAVQNGSVGFHFGLLWPRQVFGRLVEELSAQGAKAVAFDYLFADLRHDHPSVQMADGSVMESDDYFALQMRRAGNIILATTPETILPELFATNASSLGDISAIKDSDGVFRRVKAFCTIRRWHPLFQKAAIEFGADLENAQLASGKIILPRIGSTDVFKVPIDAETNFALADFVGGKLPPELRAKARAFADERVWHMGIVLAAEELGLDLHKAEVDLPRGKIILRGAKGVKRVIPVDDTGNFYVDWRLTPSDSHLLRTPIEVLLRQEFERLQGQTNGLTGDFAGRLVVVHYNLQGNNLTDEGATPLGRHALLAGVHWNVANSVITGQFIWRASLSVELALIFLLGALTAILTCELRAVSASVAVGLLMLCYCGLAFVLFVEFQFWLPLVFPIAGAMLVEHVSLVTYRVVFEEGEKRRVRSVFSKMVAPEVVNELLGMEKLSLGGARREVTVYFADVRGFTEFTDQSQANVLEFIRANKLIGTEAEAVINAEAHETLATVNLYLGTIADVIKQHNGILDKFIGDCVMAFWGAPVPNPSHAIDCVHAAMEAQRAIYRLNLKRVEENRNRELENALLPAGTRRKPKLPILLLGSGINTGVVTVGLMGSDKHGRSYTVFGREVNLASRLEGVSGRSRIIISKATYEHLRRDNPILAEACLALPPERVKGIAAEVDIYEVPWRPAEAAAREEKSPSATAGEGTPDTNDRQRENH